MPTPRPAERGAILEAKRRLKMARSTHAYVRGNTVKFYEWLEESRASRYVPEGPAIWICGDCHLGNLGPINDGDGRIAIQIRDLDQAVIGNPAHDLIRLGLSLATAARGSDLPGVTTAHMIEEMVTGYARAMRDPGGDDSGPEPEVVRSVRRRALGRRWRHLAKERLRTAEPTIPLGDKFWPLDGEERGAEEEHPGEEPRDDGGAAPAPRRRLLLLLRLRRLRLGLHRHFVSGRRDVHPHCRPRNDSL